MPNSKRIEWIDYLKAFACFLVIFGHLIQSLAKANIDPIPNITTFVNYFIYLFHMPLFMCISGFLYNKTKNEFCIENYKKFETKKIINLMVPYITFYLIFMLLNTIFSSSVNTPKGLKEWAGILNNPIPPYWYLYALISIFIIIPIIEKICNNNKKNVMLFLLFLKILSILYKPKLYLLSSFMGWGLYFYLGSFINEKIVNKKIKLCIGVTIYFMVSIFIYTYRYLINHFIIELINIVFGITGTLLSLSIFKNIKKVYFLDTFKKYTFEIYLTHTIFAACIRIILLKLNITNYIIHLIFGIIFSIYVPIIMSMISKKIGYTEFFFYPIKTINKYKERRD